MKILTTTGSAHSVFIADKPTVTISIRRAIITSAVLSPHRTERTAPTGAVLAGLALSQTLFHARTLDTGETTAHAKLRF